MKSIRSWQIRKRRLFLVVDLGEYKYYDMDTVIASALDMCERELI